MSFTSSSSKISKSDSKSNTVRIWHEASLLCHLFRMLTYRGEFSSEEFINLPVALEIMELTLQELYNHAYLKPRPATLMYALQSKYVDDLIERKEEICPDVSLNFSQNCFNLSQDLQSVIISEIPTE
mmetsp:Transcript_30937/g.47311  ORF Transcript_30937/g.47311 Transcript_30937/m.47311 type:complete len:127 (+) Transcript_30937:1782-2162(+)